MQKKCRSFLLLSFIIAFFSCSFVPNELDTVEQTLQTNPDSALKILRHLYYSSSGMSSEKKAQYGLLLFEALDKTSNTLAPDSLIEFSIKYYTDKGPADKLAKSIFYKARMYKYNQQYDEASVLYLKALDILKDSKQYKLLGNILSDQGDIYLIQNDYERARDKMKRAIPFFSMAKDTANVFYRTIDIGNTYRNEQKYTTALLYYNSALKSHPDSIFTGIINQEKGANYYLMKKLDSARFFLKESLRYPAKFNDKSIREYTLSSIFYAERNYDSAMIYAQKAIKSPSSFLIKRESYRILANSAYKQGDFKSMGNFMISFQQYSDSVRSIDKQTKYSVLEDLHQNSISYDKTRRWMFIIGSILPIIIFIGLLIYIRLRKKNQGVEQKLDIQEKKLGEYAQELITKDNFLKKSLLLKIEDARKLQIPANKKTPLDIKEKIEREIYNTCLHVDNWSSFSDLMNQTFNNIIYKLESSHPDLTKREKLWCCLFLLDIPTNDIALIMDCQQSSLYKLKQRLAQKLNFKSTMDINRYLDDLVNRA